MCGEPWPALASPRGRYWICVEEKTVVVHHGGGMTGGDCINTSPSSLASILPKLKYCIHHEGGGGGGAFLCAPKLVFTLGCAPKLVCGPVCALACAPKCVCSLIWSPKLYVLLFVPFLFVLVFFITPLLYPTP